MARGRSGENTNKAGNQIKVIPANTHSSANSPSKKRKLDDESHSEDTYTPHPQHWYRDGNLFLQIGTVRFRVYAGRLAVESRFFKALLNQRQDVSHSEDYEYQSQIDQVLSTAVKVGSHDDSDLFFLDPKDELCDGPDGNEFAALLTAMNAGVDFVYNRPTLQKVCNIWNAANFYEMPVYENFCKLHVKESFPDTWLTIAANPCELQHAVSAVRLGADYSIVCFARRPAFYDLARTSLLAFATQNGSKDAKQNKLIKSQVLDQRAELMELGADHMATLLDLQKRLGLKWVDIFRLLNVSCTEHSTCTQLSTVMAFVTPVWEDLPYDPIMGIRRILEDKNLSSTFCKDTIGQVKGNLRKEAEALWVAIGEWTNINSSTEESDNDATSSGSDSDSSE